MASNLPRPMFTRLRNATVHHGAGRCASSHAKRLDSRALEPMLSTPPRPSLLGGVKDDEGHARCSYGRQAKIWRRAAVLGEAVRGAVAECGGLSRTPGTRIWGRRDCQLGPATSVSFAGRLECHVGKTGYQNHFRG